MEQVDIDEEYGRAIDRSMTINSILSLDPVFKREYLNTQTLDSLHDLEDSLINTQYET